MSEALLITGTRGFIGRHLSAAAQAEGREVLTLDRARLDLAEASDQALQAAIPARATVMHCAGLAHEAAQGARGSPQVLRAFNGELTARLYRAAARADAARFIWLSSAKVLGEVSRAPLPVTAPLAPQGAYAHSKAAGERALQHEAARGGPALCIVRPPLVYGPGVGANFAALLRWALRGRALPLGRASAPRSLVGVRNLCSALLAAIEAPAGIYHVTDGPALSVAALLRAVGHSARRDVPLWRIPPALMALGATLVGRRGTYERLFTSLELATADSETRLSWQPPFSFEQQLQETVDWFLTQR